MTPTLNWKEIALLVDTLRGEVVGQFVDKVIVPDRSRFPGGYVKGEWMIRLRGKRSESGLLFSIRPRHPYLAYCPGKGPRAASGATHSPLSLALVAQLRDAKILSIEALHQERIVVVWFSSEERSETGRLKELGLVLMMIPAVPEALLVERETGTGAKPPAQAGWTILARSRTRGKDEAQVGVFRVPEGSSPPQLPEARSEWVGNPSKFYSIIQGALEAEAFDLRLKASEKELRSMIKQAKDRIRQSETSLREGEAEPDWLKYGELLKNHLGNPPPLKPVRDPKSGKETLTRDVLDYESDQTVTIPSDPKLGPKEQVEKFFSFARRKSRRVEEARGRITGFQETLARLEKLLSSAPAPTPASTDWPALEALERAAGIAAPASGTSAAEAKARKKQVSGWLGKIFSSRDGLSILVGRSRDENLELTFKHARGNDIWLHVRGRPGAHTVIPVQPGKSAPLETLLDAAALTVYYSGGESWGKTEVDYTFKKYVKRIKDSTEASYTNNKTLIIEPNPERLKRLLAQNA